MDPKDIVVTDQASFYAKYGTLQALFQKDDGGVKKTTMRVDEIIKAKLKKRLDEAMSIKKDEVMTNLEK